MSNNNNKPTRMILRKATFGGFCGVIAKFFPQVRQLTTDDSVLLVLTLLRGDHTKSDRISII